MYAGDWDEESVAHYIRVEKIRLFGDYLCGIEPPILSYDEEKCVYMPVVELEYCEQTSSKKTTSGQQNCSDSPTGRENESEIVLHGVGFLVMPIV